VSNCASIIAYWTVPDKLHTEKDGGTKLNATSLSRMDTTSHNWRHWTPTTFKPRSTSALNLAKIGSETQTPLNALST